MPDLNLEVVSPNTETVINNLRIRLGVASTVSPAFTGVPTGPTATPGTNTTQLATTAFVTAGAATVAGTTTSSLALKANLASPTFTGTVSIPFTQAGTGAVARTTIAKLQDTVSLADFGVIGDGSDEAAKIRAAVVAHGGKKIIVPKGTYTLSTAAAGAYVTLSVLGTELIFERGAKFVFTDAAVYGINITAQFCSVKGGFLWGTNITTPTITWLVRVGAAYVEVDGNNFAYASGGTWVDAGYVIRHLRNTYSHCDQMFKTSGTTADVQSWGNSYAKTAIGTAALVEIGGAGGADLSDYWEQESHAKLALRCLTGSLRTIVRGKFFNSGGIEVQNSVTLRLDAECIESYTGTVFCTVASGANLDLTGSNITGTAIASGITAILANGSVRGTGAVIDKWQIGIDLNGFAFIGGIYFARCTTGIDIAGDAVGNVGINGFLSNTTNIVRASLAVVAIGNTFSGSATFDAGSLVDEAGQTTTVTVTGARMGDTATASFSLDTQGITVTAWVSATDTVSVRFQNETGGTIDLASGTLRAYALPKTVN